MNLFDPKWPRSDPRLFFVHYIKMKNLLSFFISFDGFGVSRATARKKKGNIKIISETRKMLLLFRFTVWSLSVTLWLCPVWILSFSHVMDRNWTSRQVERQIRKEIILVYLKSIRKLDEGWWDKANNKCCEFIEFQWIVWWYTIKG